MVTRPPCRHDHVDVVLSEWKQERPHLNQSSTAVLSRLGRLNIAIGRELEALLARFNLTRAEYDVLATLRRKGPPFRQPLKTFLPSLMRTSGTVTFRLDRLEKKGFVRREADPVDRRSILVILTPAGEALFDSVQPLHLADGSKLLSGLSAEEQSQFVGLLKKMLLLAEGHALKGLTDTDIGLLRRYGFHLAEQQDAHGSTGVPVQHVTPLGPADQAGVQAGDVLIDVDGHSIISPDDLTALPHPESPRDTALQITVLRRGKPHALTIASHPS